MFNTPSCSPCPWPCQLPNNLAGRLKVISRTEVSPRPVQRLLDLCVCWVPYPPPTTVNFLLKPQLRPGAPRLERVLFMFAKSEW